MQSVEEVRASVSRAAWLLGYRYGPQWLLLWSHVRDRLVIDPSVTRTVSVSRDGWLYVAPEYWTTLSGQERAGVLAHEMLHLVLDHFGRAQALGLVDDDGRPRQGRDADLETWNVAADMAINTILRHFKVVLPNDARYLPEGYAGPIEAESIWRYLLSREPVPSRGLARPCAGCGVLPSLRPSTSPGAGESQDANRAPKDWTRIAYEVRAIANAYGMGADTSPLARALELATARVPWQRVLRIAFDTALARRSRERPTYSKASHRQTPPIVRPSWVDVEPRVCVIADVSGSMHTRWINQIAAEIHALRAQRSTSNVYLVIHTDRVAWHGPITDDVVIECVLGYTGGTDARKAYEVAGRAGRWDVIVHFTDCELPEWPPVPSGARLIVGAFGRGAISPSCAPPNSAYVIPCTGP